MQSNLNVFILIESVKSDPAALIEIAKLFKSELQQMYFAEKALIKLLPLFIENAYSKELDCAIFEHLIQTVDQVTRLEKAFEIVGLKTHASKCEAIIELRNESNFLIENIEKGVILDRGIVALNQKIEIYEIASYGVLIKLADALNFEYAVAIFTEIRQEEIDASKVLSRIFVDNTD